MGRMNRIAEKVALGVGPEFNGIQVAAEWMEDCASMIAGKSEELRGTRDIGTIELQGALRALLAEQRAKGRDDNIEKISKDIQRLAEEVGGLNRLQRDVVKRIVVKLAEIEKESVLIQKQLMEAR